MAPAGAPLQSGFIKSLAEPGGNVTGLSGMEAELGGKRIQLLRELIPNLTCVGVLATTPITDPFSQPFVADIQAAASTAKLKTTPVLLSGPNEFDDAFSIMAKDGAQAVIVQRFFGPYAKAVDADRQMVIALDCWFQSLPIFLCSTNSPQSMSTRS